MVNGAINWHRIMPSMNTPFTINHKHLNQNLYRSLRIALHS